MRAFILILQLVYMSSHWIRIRGGQFYIYFVGLYLSAAIWLLVRCRTWFSSYCSNYLTEDSPDCTLQDLLTYKRDEVLAKKSRYDNGLDKIVSTEAQVGQMQAELEELKPNLKN